MPFRATGQGRRGSRADLRLFVRGRFFRKLQGSSVARQQTEGVDCLHPLFGAFFVQIDSKYFPSLVAIGVRAHGPAASLEQDQQCKRARLWN